MGLIKKLASQTAVYGLSSMLGRFINFLLVIPHTKYLNSVGSFGEITSIYAYMAFFTIILTYGMDTSYFYFIRKGNDPAKVYAVSQKSILLSTSVFALLAWFYADKCAILLGFPGHADYIWCCIIFLAFDAVSALPFARLRYEDKALKFAGIKLANIIINVTLNLVLLVYTPDFLKGQSQVTLILIANAAASVFSFIMLAPLVFRVNFRFDKILLNDMLKYAWPLVFVGLAGIVNETLDRALLFRILPTEEAAYQNGIYGAFYKLTMIMTMFVQAFRFAAEPLFFKQKENETSRKVYADIMFWFTGICCLIFLACMLFINELAALFIRNDDFFMDSRGMMIVPVLLLANLFLGVYYNLGVWYKLTNNTKTGALVGIGGALITIILNLVLIPYYGFVACAWITLLVYFLMCVAAYILGNRYFPVPYHLLKYTLIIFASIMLWQLSLIINKSLNENYLQIIISLILLSVMLLIIWMLQPKQKKA